MCGIAGILQLSQSPERQLPHLLAMTRAMRHRGPDDEGYVAADLQGHIRHYIGHDTPSGVRSRFGDSTYISAAMDQATVFAMGHRRLSILDVSPAGHQPMCDPSGRYWIVFNGEIYNFKLLREELERLGFQFITSSDTEVVLAAYVCWREGCLNRFNGDFSLAIWDNEQRALFCARDRVGIKPFYYSLNKGRFLFASDIKTLIASGLYRPEPDSQGLYLAMAFGMAPRPITAFKGIQSLEQAHWMRIHADGRLEKERYWHIPVGTQDRFMTEGDAISQLEEQLQRAVARRLVADVPVGTFMSGGVDSTTVSAIAARQRPGIKAFTLGYQNDAPEMDEVPHAEATGRMHPMQHVVERVDPDQSLRDLPAWIRGYEEPFQSLAANHVISKLAAENQVKVVLNGLGGDELFAGYGYYRFSRMPQLKWLHPLLGNADWMPNRRLRTAFSVLGAKTPDRLHTLLFRQWTDRELRSLLSPALHTPMETPDLLHHLYAEGVDFGDTMEALSYMDMMNYIGNHHVHRIDQFTMAHSIEGRFPFLDHELIELAYRIPSQLKIHHNVQKYVVRRVAEPHIARECLSMKKKGFGLPMRQWMLGPLKPLVNTSLERLRERPEVQGDTINRYHDAYQQGSFSPDRIWHLVALELWFEQFIDPNILMDPVAP